jgi:lysophospholipase L1-like esterase
VIHAGGNDVHRKQSEVLKIQVASVCELAKSMADTVVFSGPLPAKNNDELYSRFSAFHRWLSNWCPKHDIGFVNNWDAFWGKPRLMRNDGIHPTLDGTSLLTHNLTAALNPHN